MSLACLRLEARTERPVHLLSAVALPSEVVMLGGRGTYARVRCFSTIGPKAPSETGDRRDSVGGVEGGRGVTMDGLEVDAEMSASKAGTDGRGAFPS